MKFVKAVREKHGWEGVGRLYTDTPKSTAVILQPERYLSGDNELQSLSLPIKGSNNEELIEVESKGAYGWMLFLMKQKPDLIKEFVPLYRKDHYMRVLKKGKMYHRWLVEFESVSAAKRVQKGLSSTKRAKRRKGAQLLWEWE